MDYVEKPLKDRPLIYHLTPIDNLVGIFQNGLKPRRSLSIFEDVADPTILEGRATRNLDQYVPFHFFNKNPFDGAVFEAHKSKRFVYLTVQREVAKKNGFLILPRHPLSGTDEVPLLGYEEGFKAIDWDLIQTRRYSEHQCKQACMAECLSPTAVRLNRVFSIYVEDLTGWRLVQALRNRYPGVYDGRVNVDPAVFPKRK